MRNSALRMNSLFIAMQVKPNLNRLPELFGKLPSSLLLNQFDTFTGTNGFYDLKGGKRGAVDVFQGNRGG